MKKCIDEKLIVGLLNKPLKEEEDEDVMREELGVKVQDSLANYF